jgi:hypothetical protein
MSTMTAESIFPLIAQLPPPERAKLREMLNQPEAREQVTEPPPAKAPRDKRLPNRPMPPSAMEAMDWIAEHQREYANQWVALDGKRLIAASPNYEEVFAAAKADGVDAPFITSVEAPRYGAPGSNEQPAKAPRDKRLPNRPMPPGGMEALRWIHEHQREYAGQWVALDGARLIAASRKYEEVFAAADADGAYAPLVTQVEDPDHIVHIIWA